MLGRHRRLMPRVTGLKLTEAQALIRSITGMWPRMPGAGGPDTGTGWLNAAGSTQVAPRCTERMETIRLGHPPAEWLAGAPR